MRTFRHENFIRRDFGFYDSGVLPVLGPAIFSTYEFMRRYVWRSLETGDPTVRTLFKQNKLVTTITQRFIAENLGYERRQTIGDHIRNMKEYGWVEIIPQTKDHGTIYVLGERLQDRASGWHEVFFADRWMMNLWDRLEAAATEKFGEGASVVKLDPKARRAMVLEYLAETTTLGDDVPSDEPDEDELPAPHVPPMSAEPSTPWTENRTPPARSNVHPPGRFSGHNNREVGNSESANREQANSELRSHPAGGRKLGSDHWDKPTKRSKTTPRDTDFTEYTEDLKPAGAGSISVSERLQAAVRAEAGVRLRGKGLADARDAADAARASDQRARQNAIRREVSGDEVKKAPATRINRLFAVWAREYRELTGEAADKWFPSDRKMMKDLLAVTDDEKLSRTIQYMFRNWNVLKQRYLKGEGTFPSVSFLTRFGGTLVPEARQWAEVSQTLYEWNRWHELNDKEPAPPELKAAFEAAQPILRTLGLFDPAKELEAVWVAEARPLFGHLPWAEPEYKKVRELLDAYDRVTLEGALRYMIHNWTKISAKILKDKAPTSPHVGFLLQFHQSIVPEARSWIEISAIHDEWKKWFKTNPGKLPPSDLSARYNAVKPQLKALGLA